MKPSNDCFNGYQLCRNWRYLKVWQFTLGPGPIPLARGPLMTTFTLRAPKGAKKELRVKKLTKYAKAMFGIKLPQPSA